MSSQDDIGPAVMGIGPCVDSINGDLGVAFGRSGTSVGLGASTNDMPTSKLDDLGL